MAEWKKVIVSGSTAELSKIVVDGHVSASLFSGSFVGDGSALTGVSSFTVSGDTNNRVITADGSGNGVGEANLTFDGSTLGVTGTILVDTIGGISGSTDTIHLGNYTGDDFNSRINGFGGDHYILQSDGAIEINHPIIKLSGIPTGTDNSVVVWTGTTLATDEIDSKVWDGNLVDKQGTPVQFQVAIFNDADTLVGSSNFTFNDSTLSVTGNVDASGPITGSNLMLDGTLADGAGETTVLVIDATGNVKSDEIDSRVWGSTLIDGSLTANRIPYASDSNTVTDSGNLTFDGSRLTVTGEASVSSNLTVGGNLFVNGDLTNINTANLNIEDQFILLNSGSSGADTGLIFGGVGGNPTGGAVFYYDREAARLAYVPSGYNYSATTVTPEAYVPVVYDVTGASHTPEDKVGNIKIEGGEAFIYV
jgi:hypothetical protein